MYSTVQYSTSVLSVFDHIHLVSLGPLKLKKDNTNNGQVAARTNYNIYFRNISHGFSKILYTLDFLNLSLIII